MAYVTKEYLAAMLLDLGRALDDSASEAAEECRALAYSLWGKAEEREEPKERK